MASTLDSPFGERLRAARAAALFAEVLALGRQTGGRFWIADGAMNLGTAVARQGELARGQALVEEALALNRGRGHMVSVVHCLAHLGAVTLARGDRARAGGPLRESMARAAEIGPKTASTEVLMHLAHLAGVEGRPERAARLLGAAEALRESVVAVFDPLLPAEHDRAVAAAQGELGEAAFGLGGGPRAASGGGGGRMADTAEGR